MDTTTHGAKKPTTGDATSAGYRQAIRDNADLLEAILAGTSTHDGLDIANAAGAIARLRDTDAGTNLKGFRWRTSAGITYGDVLNDNGTLKYTAIQIDHATGRFDTFPEGPFAATIGAGWANAPSPAYGSPQYYKFANRVFLSGAVTRTSGGSTVVTTLPDGYRPVSQVNFACYGTGGGTVGVRAMSVRDTGEIIVSAAGFEVVCFDGLSFRAAA